MRFAQAAIAAAAVLGTGAATAASPTLTFTTFAHTDLPTGDLNLEGAAYVP